METTNSLKISYFDTLLGQVAAISDEEFLYLLEFVDRTGFDRQMKRLESRAKTSIISGSTGIIASIESELKAYFARSLKEFKTPLKLFGTNFQKLVWSGLQQIPYGQTKSYMSQAESIGKPTSVRAVGNANGLNQIAIVVPCHRVIGSNGNLCGYAGGIKRKKWLIDFEKGI